MQTKNVAYFPTIDILRGFAALSVVVYHIIEHFSWKSFPIEGPLVWFRIGWMGVDLFFVISGFVIGLSAFSAIEKHGPNAFRRPFIERRLARIVPLHYLTCLLFIALVVPQLFFESIFFNLVSHALFLHNLIPGFHGAINGSNWSLGTEMQFYLLMLFIAPWIYRNGSWRVLGTLVLVAWAWRLGCTVMFPVNGDEGVRPLFLFSTQLPGMLDEFSVGLLLAKFINTERGKVWLGKSSVWSLGLAAAAMWVALTTIWSVSYWDFAPMVVFYRTLLACAFLFVIFAACTLNGSLWLKITAPLRYLGTISYGIYLWHLPVLLTFKDITWLTPERALTPVILLTIGLASVSWHFFEKPLLNRLTARERRVLV
jgi:peptidoglycan/LPS O-acetylase OafA/YrhL